MRGRSVSKADRLHRDAVEAARVRAYQTHPDVVALRVERVRSLVDWLMWVGIALGLAFTMVNVQQFAAAGAPVGSLPWCAAWLLDPMVSLVLIAVLVAEQVTARYQIPMRVDYTKQWVKRTKVFAFAATYTMNTWASWATGSPPGIVLHSVPPVLVYCAAEAGPILRDRLTEAVHRAAQAPGSSDPTHTPVNGTGGQPVNGTAGQFVNGTAGQFVNTPAPGHDTTTAPAGEHRTPRKPATPRKPGTTRRKLLAEHVAQARALLPAGLTPTPAWVREALPGIARGTSHNVANALKAEQATTTTTNPPTHPAEATGKAA